MSRDPFGDRSFLLRIRRVRNIGWSVQVVAGAALVLAASSSAGATSAGPPVRTAPAAGAHSHIKPGKWTRLSSLNHSVLGGTPAVWLSATGNATMLFGEEIAAGKFTYVAAMISPKGNVIKAPVSIFGSAYWGSLTPQPTVLSDKGEPLVIFEGGGPSKPYSDNCIVGDLKTVTGWKLQSWSLSHDCFAAIGAAAAGPKGVYAASWSSGGSGLFYRIGVSPTIPASGPDGAIVAPSDVGVSKTAIASDLAGTGDFYAAWGQSSGLASHGGLRVRNLTAHGPVRVVPGTGTQSVADMQESANLSMTNTNTHAGVWIAYCTNTNPCSLRLWKVGSVKPLRVPGASQVGNVAISAGPGGRLWVAWSLDNWHVSITRTNKADTAFGPVQTFATPCGSPGLLALTGGSFGPADVAMQCLVLNANYDADYFTRVLVPVSFSPSRRVIQNTTASKVTFKVTDVGNAVANATISVAGKTAKTGPSGKATISFPKGMKKGNYTITVSAPGYSSAHGTLVVES